MATRIISSKQILDNKNNSNNSNFAKAEFVNLKPDQSTGETTVLVRLIGTYIRFRQFGNKKRDPNDPKKSYQVPFPDAHLNKAMTRIGTENDPAYGECPWTKLGYIGSTRYAINVLERQPDGSSVVKILEKGGSVFNKLAEWEQNNREENLDNPDEEPLCVMLGGPVAHDVKIKAIRNPNALGGVEYKVSVTKKKTAVTEEEIEMLKSIYTPKPEELEAEREAWEKAREENPELQLPEWQDWFMYGYNLGNIFKPTPVRTEEAQTAQPTTNATELEVGGEDDEEETPAPAAPKATNGKAKSSASTSSRKAAAPVEDEDDNPFEDGGTAVAVAANDDDGDPEPDW